MSAPDILTIKPDTRGGKPYIRHMRIMIYDVLPIDRLLGYFHFFR